MFAVASVSADVFIVFFLFVSLLRFNLYLTDLLTAEGKMDGIMNFLAIISRRDNPRLPQAIEEFDETISFLFDPPKEPT